MIEPLRLKTIEQQILIEDHFSSSGDKHGERKTVHSFVIDSGPFKGSVVGHLRYLFDTTDTEYPWQVIKQHSPKDCDRRHYSTVKTYEQSLQLVMACAYEYVALVNLT